MPTVYLPHTQVAKTGESRLFLVGIGPTLQIQVESDDMRDAEIEIDVLEAKLLIDKLQEWINAKNA